MAKTKEFKVKIEAEAPLKGYAVVKLLDPMEVAKIGKKIKFKTNDNGEIVERLPEEQAEVIFQLAYDQCDELNIVTENGYEIKDIEKLGYDIDGREFLQKIGLKAITGVKLSPKSLMP